MPLSDHVRGWVRDQWRVAGTSRRTDESEILLMEPQRATTGNARSLNTALRHIVLSSSGARKVRRRPSVWTNSRDWRIK